MRFCLELVYGNTLTLCPVAKLFQGSGAVRTREFSDSIPRGTIVQNGTVLQTAGCMLGPLLLTLTCSRVRRRMMYASSTNERCGSANSSDRSSTMPP